MFSPRILRPLRKTVRRNKFIRNIARRTYRISQYYLAIILWKLRRDNTGILNIDPNLITHTVSRYDESWQGNTVWHFGTVSDGNWDLDGYLVEERGLIYPILKQRVIDGAQYEDIPEFLQHMNAIEIGAFIDGCTSTLEYYDRWSRIENLYWDIKENGYKPQTHLKTDNLLDEIRIQIGRNGELLLEEGRHRMIIAQLLNLDHVPAIVTRRHQKWQLLRQNVTNIVVNKGYLPQTS